MAVAPAVSVGTEEGVMAIFVTAGDTFCAEQAANAREQNRKMNQRNMLSPFVGKDYNIRR